MKVIFISGKYRAGSEWGLVENIRKAEAAAIELWKQGWVVLCPHKNTAHFGGLCPDRVWLEGDIELLKRCDAVFMLDNWHDSEGAMEEYRIAKELNKEIIFEVSPNRGEGDEKQD